MFDKMWMRALLVAVVGLAVAAVTGGPIGAQSGPAARVARGQVAAHPYNSDGIDPKAVILYNQYDYPGRDAINSQNFETAYDAYDDFLADDFNVTPGKAWRITQVDVDGLYDNGPGPAASFNVYLHRNAAGNLPRDPAAVVRLSQAYSVVGASTFRITIAPPMLVPKDRPSDHIWISVQSNMNFLANGQWYWTDRRVLSNSGSAWKNPLGGFGICPTWSLMTDCVAGVTSPDLEFTLYGFAI